MIDVIFHSFSSLDVDAHQDKGFEARDKGKAEREKKVHENANYGSVDESYRPVVKSPEDNSHVSFDYEGHTPQPDVNPYDRLTTHEPTVHYEEPVDNSKVILAETSPSNKKSIKIATFNNNNSTSASISPSNYILSKNSSPITLPRSIVTHVDPPASVTYLTYQASASDPVSSIASPVNSQDQVKAIPTTTSTVLSSVDEKTTVTPTTFAPTTLAPTTLAPTTVLPFTTSLPEFVEIIANVTSMPVDSSSTTVTSSTASYSSTTQIAEVRQYRRPPNSLINALHIIESPNVFTHTDSNHGHNPTANTTHSSSPLNQVQSEKINNIPTFANDSHHKFSKLVSIEAPPSVYAEALKRANEAKVKAARAEKLAREKKERERIAFLSRLVKANSYATQPAFNAYLPYASSSNDYSRYIMPVQQQQHQQPQQQQQSNNIYSKKAMQPIPMSSGTGSSSQMINDPMASLSNLLSASSSPASSMSGLLKGMTFSPLTSFSSTGLYPFRANSGRGKTRSRLNKLASTLNPRVILPSVREYTRSLTQPLTNVLNPFTSSSEVQETILPLSLTGNSKHRLFPVSSASDTQLDSILQSLTSHAKRMDHSAIDTLVKDEDRQKRILSLLESTFTTIAREYPAISTTSSPVSIDDDTTVNPFHSLESFDIPPAPPSLRKLNKRDNDDDDDDDLAAANNFNHLHNADDQFDRSTVTPIEESTLTSISLSSTSPPTSSSSPFYDASKQFISRPLMSSETSPTSLDRWIHHTTQKPVSSFKNNSPRSTPSRGVISSSSPIFTVNKQSSKIEDTFSQPVYLKNSSPTKSLVDAIRHSKWIAQSI